MVNILIIVANQRAIQLDEAGQTHLDIRNFIVGKRLRSAMKSDSRLFDSFTNKDFLSQGALNVRKGLEKNQAG